ncbi:AAA family ATPase [Niveibacterium sp. SC-1]|uniref:AAA family ATPase n=1 Tax=Niveibacterium sp. SC-1 TaxID=3135646 RepID=UPI00311E1FBD
MPKLIILSGSLGSGKTTVAKLLAASFERGTHIESDIFYTFFSHPIAPHLPTATSQNRAAIASATQAARSLCASGYDVVLEGIFGPWFLPVICGELADAHLDLRYVVLRTTVEAALSRVRQRAGAALDEVVSAMHPQFESLGPWEPHVLETTELAPQAVLVRLREELAGGRYLLRADAVPRAVGG